MSPYLIAVDGVAMANEIKAQVRAVSRAAVGRCFLMCCRGLGVDSVGTGCVGEQNVP